tara:strand:+ start:120 stop:356 length:237 start_codon:yes stop_codon:yes gene_type:complete
MTTEIQGHGLVPKHFILSNSEKKELFIKQHFTTKTLPKILITDPTLINLKVKVGDIIKIERKSETAGITYYYRVVIEE